MINSKEPQGRSRLEEARSGGKKQCTIMEFLTRTQMTVENTPQRGGETEVAVANDVDPPSEESERGATGPRPDLATGPYDDKRLAAGHWSIQQALSPGSRTVSWNVGLQGIWSRQEVAMVVD